MSDEGSSATPGESMSKSKPQQARAKGTRPRTRDGLFKKNNWWWIDYYDTQGKRHRKKAAPDYQTARLIYRDTMTAIAKGEVLGVREEGLRFLDFVEKRYWPTVEASVTPAERARARIILDTQLLPRFGDIKLVKLRREDIDRWQADRLTGTGKGQRAVAPATTNKELMRLKHCLNRAVAWGYLRESPAKTVRKVKESPGRVRFLTEEERAILTQGASNDLGAIIVAALQTGARRGELLGLRWSDVDVKGRTLSFERTKNGDRRVIAMTETLRNTLRALPRRIGQERVFADWTPMALTMAFGRLTRSLKLSNLRFHDLRHDTASQLTMSGVPQRTVMEILGHRDPRMTLRYQHLAPGHLRDAMRTLDAPSAAPGARAVKEAQ